MAMTLDTRQLQVLLAAAIRDRKPVLVTGMPGIAKTSVIELAIKQAKNDQILSFPGLSDPTDYKGYPSKSDDGKSATFLPFGDFNRALKAKKPTTWYFDDLGQAPTSVQQACMQLFLARQVNGHRLPDCITFIGATNRRIDRAGVSGILEPVKSRFVTIVELMPRADHWAQDFALLNGIDPRIIAFHRFRPDSFCAFQPSADITNSPIPRTWKHVDDILKMQLPRDIETVAIAGAIGEGFGIEFCAFMEMYRQLPSRDQILANPDVAPIPTGTSALYATVGMLAASANENTIGRIATYLNRLVDAKHGEYATLCARDAMRRDPSIISTDGFIKKIAAGPIGVLMSGESNAA